MAINEPEFATAVAVATKKRTFKKFSFRGFNVDALLKMSNVDLAKLFNARVRRRFYRGLKKKPLILIKKLRRAKKEASDENKKMIIVPEMIGSVVGVHNGKKFNEIVIKPEMIGHYLAEFSMTCKKVNHYRPRICGCGCFRRSTRFIPLR
ncbi:Ribosomal protein S19A/S15e [Arabidopsis thaliana x Arabidopsis arenosa]|uniref:Ribosomal protein S19A/S15e n=1 Tax=Arabidopsis thaliana x Arabidopsis arenosa TaxID=1240361 RepID=A0A8T1XL73_9BRAS|nr:Ribosomal protein S19A/S15e [Arabidopsis thaliana x Arabidopsis arenosa]